VGPRAEDVARIDPALVWDRSIPGRRAAGTYDRGEALHGPDEGGNERQSKVLDTESRGITSESKLLLSDMSGITSDVIPLHWQSSADHWQCTGV
jgi:hypothetical protein